MQFLHVARREGDLAAGEREHDLAAVRLVRDGDDRVSSSFDRRLEALRRGVEPEPVVGLRLEAGPEEMKKAGEEFAAKMKGGSR